MRYSRLMKAKIFRMTKMFKRGIAFLFKESQIKTKTNKSCNSTGVFKNLSNIQDGAFYKNC